MIRIGRSADGGQCLRNWFVVRAGAGDVITEQHSTAQQLSVLIATVLGSGITRGLDIFSSGPGSAVDTRSVENSCCRDGDAD